LQARGLERLELVQLEVAGQAALGPGTSEDLVVEVARVLREQAQAVHDGLARAQRVACGLALRDLRDEGVEERAVQGWILEAVVETEGLRGEVAQADAAEEALDDARVAAARVAALALPEEGRAWLARGTGGVWAVGRGEGS